MLSRILENQTRAPAPPLPFTPGVLRPPAPPTSPPSAPPVSPNISRAPAPLFPAGDDLTLHISDVPAPVDGAYEVDSEHFSSFVTGAGMTTALFLILGFAFSLNVYRRRCLPHPHTHTPTHPHTHTLSHTLTPTPTHAHTHTTPPLEHRPALRMQAAAAPATRAGEVTPGVGPCPVDRSGC